MPGEHARLSPSSSHRWLACTKSVQLESRYPESTSKAADEGTTAHKLSELLLKLWMHNTGPYTDPKEYSKRQQEIKAEIAEVQQDEHYLADPTNMQRYCEEFRDFVIAKFQAAQKKTKDAMLELETKTDLRAFLPEGFGTVDITIIADGVLQIIDLKYGKGHHVDADNNSQLMIYAAGVYEEYCSLYDIHTVEMTIYQPRTDNIGTFEIPASDLLDWAENFVKPRAILAFNGEGEYVAGHHCKFCKAKFDCSAKAKHEMAILEYTEFDNDVLDDNALADIVDRAGSFIEWAKGVKEFAITEALSGRRKLPGFKIVEGKSNRKYADPEAVAKVLMENGVPEDKIYKPAEVRALTELSGIVGKKAFENYLGDLLIKPDGAPTLAHTSDKRPEYNPFNKNVNDIFADVEVD